jgi:hypothetical protein
MLKMFKLFWTDVAIISHVYCKSDFAVAHIAARYTYRDPHAAAT